MYLIATRPNKRSRFASAVSTPHFTSASTAASIGWSLRSCSIRMPWSSRLSRRGGTKPGSASSTMKEPFFFCFSVSSAAGAKPGATMPSDTTPFKKSAVASSTVSESAAKSPNEHFGSAPRART